MKTISRHNLTVPSLKEKVSRFYDLGSPYYLQVFGRHIHDGYYFIGRETREEAQENLIKFLVDKAKIEPGSTILDVGSGVGGSSIWLTKNLEARTTGITISSIQLEIARQLAQQQRVDSRFLLMDAENIEFTDQFNYVWMVAVLTHLKDQEKFLRSSARILTSRGKLIIFDWNLSENFSNSNDDPDVKAVIEGLVLSGLYPSSAYLRWLAESGYQNIFAEDITERTIRTWDGALSLIREPRIWKLGLESTSQERREVLTFFRGARAIKRAMVKGKVRSTAIVAQKTS
jgi:tocopherol O-methyltransferase